MKRKNSIISSKAVEDFYIADKSNINFWVARLEKYSPERVKAVCKSAGTDDTIAEQISREIDRYADSRIKMSDVRPLIFSLLQRRDPKAAKRFRAGEIYVRTSKEVIERFNRGRITVSLVKETRLDEEVAKKIARETEAFIKKENLDFVSSSLVREIANIKMLERGFEKERKLYTRVGMPVFDLENLILRGSKENANLQYNPETIHKLIADQSSKQYTLTKLLSLELADAHMKGEIHIHDLDYFPYRPFCFSHDVRFFMKNGFKPDGTGLHTSVAGPAKHPKVLLLHSAKALAAAQTNFGGGQGFSYFNTFLAPMIVGLNYKEVKQLAQLFIYEMSQTYIARGGQTVFSSIDLDMHVPEMFKNVPAICLGGKVNGTYSDYEDETNKLFNAFVDVYMEGDYRGKPFNFPKFELQIYPNELDKNYDDLLKVSELAAKYGTPYYIINQPYMPKFSCYQCCSFLMPLDEANEQTDIEDGTLRGGSLQVITVNLPQIAYGANGDDNRFFEILDDRFEKAKRVMMLRYKIIEENLKNAMLPFLSQKVNERGDRYLEPKKQSYTIGIVGINEMVKYHTGEELHESENAWKFGLRAMKYMKQKVAEFREETGLNFALARTPAESCATRLASIDKKRFGKRAITQGDGKGIYYTNSFHVRPNANIPLFKRMGIEGSFHPLTDGGAMSHIWLGEAYPNAEAILNLTKKLAKKTAIQYMAFTKDLTVCNDCNFVVGGLHDGCPRCNSGNTQQLSRITGYYQNVAGWNPAKRQELKDRQRYMVTGSFGGV